MRAASQAFAVALLLALAGCGQRADPRIIEGRWVAEKFRVQGIGLPIGPDLHIERDRIGLGAGMEPVMLQGMLAEGDEVTLQTKLGLDIVFAFDGKDRMYFSIPFTGDRIYYRRSSDIAVAIRSAAPTSKTAPPAPLPASTPAIPGPQATVGLTKAGGAQPVATGDTEVVAVRQPVPPAEKHYEEALAAMRRGDESGSLRSLSAALANGFSDWRRIESDPLLAGLDGDVRFQVLRAKWKKS